MLVAPQKASSLLYRKYQLITLTAVILWAIGAHQTLHACTLKMGYRISDRVPLIGKDSDNSGLYYDLYSRAAQKIECRLEVIRKSKLRIIRDLQTGNIDFYPGFNFTTKRAVYTYYLENGLPGGDAGISRSDFREITHLSQLKGDTLFSALGGPNYLEGVEGVYQKQLAELTTQRAIRLLLNERAEFYIYNKSSIEF